MKQTCASCGKHKYNIKFDEVNGYMCDSCMAKNSICKHENCNIVSVIDGMCRNHWIDEKTIHTATYYATCRKNTDLALEEKVFFNAEERKKIRSAFTKITGRENVRYNPFIGMMKIRKKSDSYEKK
jgi:hypothetical protein